MRRALVSGGTGFIGRRLVAGMRQDGVHVITIGRRPLGISDHLDFGPLPWQASQWAQAIDTAAPDAIFHLAGAREGTQDDLEAVNLGLARTLISALQARKVAPTLIVAGSAAECGSAIIDGVPIDETIHCAPQAIYGRTKLAQTRAVLDYAAQTGNRAVVARIFNPIGPGMPPHLALGNFARQIVAAAASGSVLATGNLEVERDFLDVDHAATALAALACNVEAQGIVNVCSGIPRRLRDLVDTMIEISGKRIRLEIDPARVRANEPRTIVGSTKLLGSYCGKLPAVNMTNLLRCILTAEAAGGAARRAGTAPDAGRLTEQELASRRAIGSTACLSEH
jgi:GDP-4-dehydro-6-deoxy-D-mannose reductase